MRFTATVLAAFLGAVTLFGQVALPVGSASPLPAYPGCGIKTDSQTWWEEPGKAQEHMHMVSCIPWFTPSTGTINTSVEFKLHNSAGTINRYRDLFSTVINPGFRGDGQHLIEQMYVSDSEDLTLRADGASARQIEGGFKDDLGTVPQRLVRTKGGLVIDNAGDGTLGYGFEELITMAWFAGSTDGRGYSNAAIKRSSLPIAANGDVVVSGLWVPKVRFGSSNGQPRNGFVSIDPDVHNGYMGQVVLQVTASPSGDWLSAPIDTLALPNGTHKLMIKSSDENMAFPNGTMSGVMVLFFTVNN